MAANAEQQRGRSSRRFRGRGSSKARGGGGGRFGSRGKHDESDDRQKRRDVGRAEWSQITVDKRARNEANQQAVKRRKIEGEDERLPIYATRFSQEEIEAQEKRPKRKVAVMIGYSGSGYKGMQLNHHEKTIEGDLFSAFVAAGAISKANADDPKKSSLIRCARTDKGVHAGGNLISLKLIVEDADIVAKINEQLDPQIRIWGFGRTNGGFSSYQHCDSRIYEYLIPSHCFLPPHPKSFLAKRLEELAEEANDRDGYRGRQEEVADFWTEAEKYLIQPVIDKLDPAIRDKVLDIFYGDSSDNSAQERPNEADNQRQAIKGDTTEGPYTVGIADPTITPHLAAAKEEYTQSKSEGPRKLTPTEVAVRELKAAYTDARNGYRIHPARLARVRSAFSRFEGSHKFHNYTINKSFKDASVTRVMKSLSVRENPLLVGGTEWLSVKIHGQSFMMHQIRKMVSMIALVVRCGCPEERLQESYLPERISIPKAPSLGLLLERPVFDVYNEQLEKFGRERIDFGKYSTEMEEFKQREIYERIYHEEGRDGCFHSFFTALDNTKSPQLLYLSSVGMKATERDIPRGNTGLRKDGGDVAQDVDQSSSDDEMQDGEEE